MDKLGLMVGDMNGAGVAVLIAILVVFALFLFRKLRTGKKPNTTPLPSTETKPDNYEALSEEVSSTTKKTARNSNKLGHGDIKCMCFRKIKGIPVVDFTTMEKPIGEMYRFDPSCPIQGSGYIVKETARGEIEDYDPREVEYVVEESPEYAYFASDWPEVKLVFYVPVKWWKSASVLFAWAIIGVVLLVYLARVG